MKQMTSLERCQAVMNGAMPDRVPVVPQAFMFACKTAGYTIGQINKNGKLMAETHRICQEKYGYDGVVIDIDDCSLAEACGAKVIFREQDVATVDESRPLLRDLRDVDDLPLPDPAVAGRLPEWLEATRVLRETIGDRVLIMGRADQGPFSLACLLRGTEQFMMDVVTAEPGRIHKVIDYCRRAVTRFARAQIQAGAHLTSIGDSLAGPNLISPQTYRSFALEYEKELIQTLAGEGVPFSLHICGNTTGILPDMAQTHAKVVELDWQVDLSYARQVLGTETVIMGNVDPSDPLVWGTPETILGKAKDVIEKTKGFGLFLSSGCAMGYNTPPENMQALIEAAQRYGTAERLYQLQNEKSF